MSDLVDLYSSTLLALAANIAHQGRLEAPQASVTRRAPLCGSSVTVDLTLDARGRVSAFAQEVRACALGQAAAALVGRAIIGADLEQIRAGRDALALMLREDGPPPQTPFTGFEVLRAVQPYKSRHASTLLAFEASLEAASLAAEKR